MKFETLEDAERNCNLMAHEIETMLGVQVGQVVVLSALIATHPDYDHLQMQIAKMLEVFDGGSLGKALSDRQRQVARDFVEELQRIRPARGKKRSVGLVVTGGWSFIAGGHLARLVGLMWCVHQVPHDAPESRVGLGLW